MMIYLRDFFSTLARRLRRWPHFANGLPAVLCAAGASALATLATGSAAPATPATGVVDRATLEIALDHPLAHFFPIQAIGGALDGRGHDEALPTYRPSNLRAMLGAGLGAVTYRLRTELGVQAWHFDAAGTWSEPARAQGYWTGASVPPKQAQAVSWGYALPRRGDTFDQAEDTGYSRLDDGSLGTFWKSNPYLASPFTHESDARHPQWVMIDLGEPRGVDAIRIAWAAPYATRFRVQHYVGGPNAVALAPGHWVDFPQGSFRGGPGTQTLRLARAPLSVRFVRILLIASSHTALATERRSTGPSPFVEHDARDRLGYAIRELYIGTSSTVFHDLLAHAANQGQTAIYTSSTDPWHTAADLNDSYEQPSFQTVLRSGLTRGQPLLVPVPVLYGTPRNAVAELRYLRALGARLRGVELGEEPDGQLISPEDYGALYVQFARAIRHAFPHLPLGGPGFASSIPDWEYWPNAHGDRSWTRRFVDYLQAHRAMRLLGFFSFEWYPFDDVCGAVAPRLERSSSMLRAVLAEQHREGVPHSLPIYVTEYGYSAYAGEAEVDMGGALFDADTVGTLLSEGVKAAYLYGYEPNAPIREARGCDTWGNLMLLREGMPGTSPRPVAAYWETRMLTHDWAQANAAERPHTLYAVSLSGAEAASPSPTAVHAYALRRPDGRLAVLLINLDPARSYRMGIRLAGVRTSTLLRGPLQQWTLSSTDYAWRAGGPAGAPGRDKPPTHRLIPDASAGVELPPYSVTVLRSALG